MIDSLESYQGFALGGRVQDVDGFKATIRYIGPVIAATDKNEIWLGVEWDSQSRGKHDGSCVDDKGVLHRYFHCRPGSGSFIRTGKVTSGVSLCAALSDRYGQPHDLAAGGERLLSDAFVRTSKGNQRPIEFVGADNIRSHQQLSSLLKASARNASIACACRGEEDLQSLAGHLQELDLQDNLLSRWEEVFAIISNLRQLRVLLLHGNKLQPLLPQFLPQSAFDNLKIVALNGCGLHWKDVRLFGEVVPAVEELYLANNPLSEDFPLSSEDCDEERSESVCDDEAKAFNCVRILDLTSCGLQSWSQVCYFGGKHGMEQLQELLLDANPISHILPCEEGLFSRLQRISIAQTLLSSWGDIDHLNSLPSLVMLRCSQVPLFSHKGASEVRPVVIARLPKLAVFNGSSITAKERVTAEKHYLRIVWQEIAGRSTEDVSGVLSLLHPRFQELSTTYADDLALFTKVTTAQNGQKSLLGDLVSVTFINFSFSTNGSLEPIVKRLPRSLTVGKLRALVKQNYGLDPAAQKLSLRVFKDSPPMILEDEATTLQYYGIQDGAEIFINE